jgi:hypothetical protein
MSETGVSCVNVMLLRANPGVNRLAPRAIQALTNDASSPLLHAFGTIVKSGIIGWRNDGRR